MDFYSIFIVTWAVLCGFRSVHIYHFLLCCDSILDAINKSERHESDSWLDWFSWQDHKHNFL